jgi:bacillithiol biosynthesis deacetylase BshB1
VHLDVLAIGAHPDDAELGCGGTVALLAARGRRVGLLHLTGGEAGTRGTARGRRREAERAAEALGAAHLEFLDCGDGGLRGGADEEDALIEVVRRLRPELVLGPAPSDRHPDHGRAHRLVEAACFYAGLAGRRVGARPGPRGRRSGPARRGGSAEPHRPAAHFSYMQHDPFEPSFVVDVTAAWAAKMAALDAYESQIHRPGSERAGPPTLVASEPFRLAVEGRARHFGVLVGATFGEPFLSRLPLAVGDPLDLLPGGLR